VSKDEKQPLLSVLDAGAYLIASELHSSLLDLDAERRQQLLAFPSASRLTLHVLLRRIEQAEEIDPVAAEELVADVEQWLAEQAGTTL